MIKIYCNEQILELKTDIDIASDTIEFVSLNFTFCDSWKDYDKTVQFTQRTNTYSVNLGINGTNCFLPNEITDGLCAISVFGTKNKAKRATTVPLNIRIKRSGFIEDGIVPSDTQPSVIEQLIEDNKTIKENIEDIKDNIDVIEKDIKNIQKDNETITNRVEDLAEQIGSFNGGSNRINDGFYEGRGFITFGINNNSPLINTFQSFINLEIAKYSFITPDIADNADAITASLQLYSSLKIMSDSPETTLAANPKAVITNPRIENGHYLADIIIHLDQLLETSTLEKLTVELYWAHHTEEYTISVE